jgi:hypothetical protein
MYILIDKRVRTDSFKHLGCKINQWCELHYENELYIKRWLFYYVLLWPLKLIRSEYDVPDVRIAQRSVMALVSHSIILFAQH